MKEIPRGLFAYRTLKILNLSNNLISSWPPNLSFDLFYFFFFFFLFFFLFVDFVYFLYLKLNKI